MIFEEFEDVKAIAFRHLEVGDDVGWELELFAIGKFAFASEIGNGFIAAGGKLDFVRGTDTFKGCLSEKPMVCIIVNDQ